MPLEHIGIDWDSRRVRLARVATGFGSVEFVGYEEFPIEAPASAPSPAPAANADAAPPGEPPASPENTPGESAQLEWTPAELALQAALGQLAARGTFESRFTSVALPAGAVTTRVLSFPFTSRKKIELVLRPELETLTPFEGEDFVADHVILEKPSSGARLLVFACEKLRVARLLEGARLGRWDPKIVSVTGAALAALPLLVGEPAPEPPPPPEDLPAGEKPKGAKPPRKAAERTSLEAAPCTGILYLAENEICLCVLRRGSPWMLHGSSLTLPQLRTQGGAPTAAAGALLRELRRALVGFESNFGERPAELWALGEGAADERLLAHLAGGLELPILPGRLDPGTAGEEAARMLAGHPEAALPLALAYQSAREKRVPAPNLRRDEFSFRGQWRDLAEPLFVPAALLAACIFLFLINSLLALGNYRHEAQLARAQLRQIYQEARGGEPPPDPLAALRRELEDKRQRLEIFKAISGISILNILAEISKSIGNDVQLDFENFQIDSDRVSINGRTEKYESIDKIQHYLEKSTLFKKVEFRDAVPSPDQKIKFRLALTLSTAEDDKDEEAEELPEELPEEPSLAEPGPEAAAPGAPPGGILPLDAAPAPPGLPAQAQPPPPPTPPPAPPAAPTAPAAALTPPPAPTAPGAPPPPPDDTDAAGRAREGPGPGPAQKEERMRRAQERVQERLRRLQQQGGQR